ncbi:hypothetical protein BC827DRAFT_1375379 [Russula dissimulans]|nr:hypothetical protein BC827DRAFT_1375379 [Russula dissimulans]
MVNTRGSPYPVVTVDANRKRAHVEVPCPTFKSSSAPPPQEPYSSTHNPLPVHQRVMHPLFTSDLAFLSQYDPQEDQAVAWSETQGCSTQPILWFDPALGPDTDIEWNLAEIFATSADGRSDLTTFGIPSPTAPAPSLNGVNYPDDTSSAVTSLASDVWWMGLPPLSVQQAAVPLTQAPIPSGTWAPTNPLQTKSVRLPFEGGQYLGPLPYSNVYGDMAGQTASGHHTVSFGFTGNVLEHSYVPFLIYFLSCGGNAITITFADAGGDRFPTRSKPAGLDWPPSMAVASVADVTQPPRDMSLFQVPVLSRITHGKRRREGNGVLDDGNQGADYSYGPRPCKKGKVNATTIGVSEAERSTLRTHHKSAARTLTVTNRKSKAVGRGAEKLATPQVQGVYHQSLQGPSTQQELVNTLVQEQLSSVEGSTDGAWHHTGSMVQEQEVAISANEGEPGVYRIPKRPDEWNRAMLRATPADWARGTIRVLKCRLCPDINFSRWEDFKRHSDSAETHPRTVSFCDECGDYFARPDSLKRHQEKRPPECLKVSPTTAENKRRATERVHVDFVEHTRHCLRSGEQLEAPLAQIIKTMYPESSKRVSRWESGVQASKWMSCL